MSCIFCEISKGNDKKNWIFETDKCCCFPDINPVSPVHLLIIPRIHIESLTQVRGENIDYIKDIYINIPRIIKKTGLKSYRLISNTGENAGQSVKHLHFHILGGREFGWPPG